MNVLAQFDSIGLLKSANKWTLKVVFIMTQKWVEWNCANIMLTRWKDNAIVTVS